MGTINEKGDNRDTCNVNSKRAGANYLDVYSHRPGSIGGWFLIYEGLRKNKQEIVLVQVCPQGDNIDICLKHPIDHPNLWRRTSGCTGGVSAIILEEVRLELLNGFMLTPSAIDQLLESLNEAQVYFREVGGVHTSILSDGSKVVVSAENVGQHNSLDKIAGSCLLDDIHFVRSFLAITGWISSEMIQIHARITASIVISRSSASPLSVDLADRWGITLIGYARNQQFVVYTRRNGSCKIPMNRMNKVH